MQAYDDPDLPLVFNCCKHCTHENMTPDMHDTPCVDGCNDDEEYPHE